EAGSLPGELLGSGDKRMRRCGFHGTSQSNLGPLREGTARRCPMIGRSWQNVGGYIGSLLRWICHEAARSGSVTHGAEPGFLFSPPGELLGSGDKRMRRCGFHGTSQSNLGPLREGTARRCPMIGRSWQNVGGYIGSLLRWICHEAARSGSVTHGAEPGFLFSPPG